MPVSIYPTNPTQWIALIAALIPVIMWAVTGFVRGLIMWSRRREEQWQRLHELADILYNKDQKWGLWRQLLAAQELERLKTRKKEAKVLANNSVRHFSDTYPNQPEFAGLIEQLQKFGR